MTVMNWSSLGATGDRVPDLLLKSLFESPVTQSNKRLIFPFENEPLPDVCVVNSPLHLRAAVAGF